MTELLSPAQTKTEIFASLGLSLLDRAMEIADSKSIASRTYRFGPLSVALQVAGQEYSSRLTSAVQLAGADATQSNHFRIIALDSHDPAVGRLPHERFLHAYSRQLEQQFECKDRHLLIRYDANGETWRVASLAQRTAVSWIADARQLPDWENAAPLRDILHWACISTPWFLAHGAAISVGEDGILFTGPGGSGKSTTTAAAVLSGLQTAGDDFVLVDPTKCEIHALYNAIKLNPDGLRRLTDFSIEPDNQDRPAADKMRFRTTDVRDGAFVSRMRLRAIVVPRLAQFDKTAILPASQSEVMRALAPSTLLLLRGGQIETAAKVAALIRSVPAFRLELGHDPSEVARTLAELIRERLQ